MKRSTDCFAAFAYVISILFVVYTCGAIADNLGEGSIDGAFLNDLKNEPNVLDTQKSLLQKAETQCSKDSDCHYAGKCTKRDGELKVCECRTGTSGSLCQDVEGCIANPNMCGNGTDVQCIFDVVREKAICKCDNTSKEFDQTTKTCRVPCEDHDDCGLNGRCSKKFCRCRLGASGDFCENIDQCQSKEVDCGSAPGVICALGEKGQAYCKCEYITQGYDYDTKTCKACNCGKNYISCKFENGTKTCFCKGSYAQRFSECASCDCSYFNSLNCSFNAAGEKICTCKPSYVPGQSGWCIGRCDSDSGNKCGNGGTCNNGTCHCPKGTTGDYCYDVDWCEDFRCGNHYETMCVYNPKTTMGECKCREENSVYDDNVKDCFECDCGPFGNCTFVNGSKICKCQEGYSLHNSKCEKCDCGKDESTLCILRYNYKECRCKKNYSQRTGYFPKYGKDTRCDYCNCGDHGECIFDGGYKKCICEENYLERSGKCEECSCGEYGTCKFREGDRKKICICEYGYADQNGKCVACNCNPIDLRGIGNCSYVDNTKQCDCPNGYQFSTTFFSCEDINECLQGSVCPSSTNCVNVPGSFQCECKRGYKLANDWDNPKEVGCADVDECSLGGTCSSGTTRCINTLGSYDCVCREGYYATAAVQGDTYMPMYNVCYGKQTQWEGATIAIAVILVCGIILACCSIVNRKCN